MKKIISLALAAMTAFSFCACNVTEQLKDEPLGTNAVYDVMGLGEIPVGMWVTPPTDKDLMVEYKKMADVGINMVNGFGWNESTPEEYQAVMDACEANGLIYLLSSLELEEVMKEYANTKDPALIEEAMTYIEQYASHPAYAGQLFIDEPSVRYFDALGDLIDEYRLRFPGEVPYVNMLPYYAMGGTGAATYEEYYDFWVDRVKPDFYSYDSYPLVNYDPTMVGYEAEMKDFYYNLDLIRDRTLKDGIPMWTFICTHGYDKAAGSSEPNRREPSREDMRWQVFSNLAFGAKALQYYMYWTTSSSIDDAIVDKAGNPTETYYHVQEVNREFKNYGSILLNADAVGVMIEDYRRGGFDIYTTPLKKFGAIQSVEGNRYVIGCFSDKDTGKKSVLITPTTPRDDIEVTLNMHKSVKTVRAFINNEWKTLKVKNNKLKLNIKKGDAVFIQL